MTAFGQGFGLFFFYTGPTQGKGEFPATTMRKDRVVETVGRKNLTLDEPKVRGDVGAARFVEDSGMSYRVEAILVGPRVEGREVIVVDRFSLLGHVVQFDGIGATAEEGISGLEPGYEFEGIDQGTDRFVVSLQFFPFALPHDDDTVPQGEQDIFFASGGFVDVAHALIAWHHGPGNTLCIRAKSSRGIRRRRQCSRRTRPRDTSCRRDGSRVHPRYARVECGRQVWCFGTSTIPGPRGNGVYLERANR